MIKAVIKRILWDQLGKPSGWKGDIIGRLMIVSNAPAHDFTLSQACPEPEDCVLEVGFGGGAFLQKAVKLAPRGIIHGVDVSEIMMRQARERNAAAIREGRVVLRLGEVSRLPYEDESFDKVFSVHSIYFWPNPPGDLKEILRVLKPGGLVVITIDPSEHVEPPLVGMIGFSRWGGEALLSLIEKTGSSQAKLEARDDLGLVCVSGQKPF